MPSVNRGEGNDEPEYPKAPMPAHERSWRHPSEVGATQWALNEPPLVVGRGLSIATGTIGAALAVGLLWIMIPHHSAAGVSAVDSATTIREVAIPVDPAAPADTSAPEPTSAAPPAPSGPPMPTMLVGAFDAATSEPAAAVALTPGHFVITTAQAVSGRQGIEVVLPSGETVVGAVVLVDKASGTAVLSIPAEIDASIVELSSDASRAGGLVMMSPKPLKVTFVSDDKGLHLSFDNTSTPVEGSIVVDYKGRLLGLCTLKNSQVLLVSVETMLNALEAAANLSVPAWLGIQPEPTTDDHGVSVAAVVSHGPADAAGLHEGDVIEAIDDMPVALLNDLGQVIAAHAAGDSVHLTVRRAGETKSVVVAVVLSSHPSSM